MSSPQQKRPKKSRPTYITSIISISLILLVLGLIATFFIQSARLTQSVKENMAVQLVIKESLNESDCLQYAKQLEAEVYVKNAEQVSKKAAAELMMFFIFVGWFKAVAIPKMVPWLKPNKLTLFLSTG